MESALPGLVQEAKNTGTLSGLPTGHFIECGWQAPVSGSTPMPCWPECQIPLTMCFSNANALHRARQ